MGIRETGIEKTRDEFASPAFQDVELLAAAETVGTPVRLRGGEYSIMSQSVSGAVTLQLLGPDDVYVNLIGNDITTNDSNMYKFARGSVLRSVVSVATPVLTLSSGLRA